MCCSTESYEYHIVTLIKQNHSECALVALNTVLDNKNLDMSVIQKTYFKLFDNY